MKLFQVDIVSLERLVFSGQASFVVVPGEQGDLGILPGHAPLMAELRPGWVRVDQGDPVAEEHFYVSGGAVEVQPKRVTILLDFVLAAREDQEKQQGRENLLRARVSALEYAQMEAALYKALNGLQSGQHPLRSRRIRGSGR
ncbi:ATP synthase F1 subunit epsilon [Ferrovum myxofaciens]|uniref:ATP synthase F1 subunit epsilon n=1 Tax=Ferrovum myxofaciens TaxID=416213 RepID=UPI0004E17A80|nr:ATP synthase F1 subunit epsilon [Ferrovum myxofaciens]